MTPWRRMNERAMVLRIPSRCLFAFKAPSINCTCVVTPGLRGLRMCCQTLCSLAGGGSWWRNEHPVHSEQVWWTFLQPTCQPVALCCVAEVHILVCHFTGTSPRHTCVRILLLVRLTNQDGRIILGEMLTNTDFSTFLNQI